MTGHEYMRTVCPTTKVGKDPLREDVSDAFEDGVLQSKKSSHPLSTYDIIKVAKHFYELGLKAQKGE